MHQNSKHINRYEHWDETRTHCDNWYGKARQTWILVCTGTDKKRKKQDNILNTLFSLSYCYTCNTVILTSCEVISFKAIYRSETWLSKENKLYNNNFLWFSGATEPDAKRNNAAILRWCMFVVFTISRRRKTYSSNVANYIEECQKPYNESKRIRKCKLMT